jgi:hypothetical protein
MKMKPWIWKRYHLSVGVFLSREGITMMIMSMGWDYVSELRPPTGLLFIPMWYNMQNHGGIISIGKTSESSTRALWQSYQQNNLVVKQEKLEKEMMNFAVRSILHTSNGFLTCRKIFRHGANGFISSQKEGVLFILIALKNTSSSTGF